MKSKLLSYAVVVFLFTALLGSCKPKNERVDDIVKDLATESYSLNFDKQYPEFGITKTAYGTESYLVYAEPGDVICPDPIRIRLKGGGIPIFKNPKIIWPTCPDFVPINLGEKFKDILAKADAEKFTGLELVKLANNSSFLASKQFKSQFASLKPDAIDDSVLANMDADKFLILQDPGNLSSGFTRYFYGGAPKIDFSRFRPILIGCFDPRILLNIKERLVAINPAVYKSLNVSPAAGADSTIAVLSLRQ
jgi:hypothetical protein